MNIVSNSSRFMFWMEFWNVCVVFCMLLVIVVGRWMFVIVCLMFDIVLFSDMFGVRLNDIVIVGSWFWWLIVSILG